MTRNGKIDMYEERCCGDEDSLVLVLRTLGWSQRERERERERGPGVTVCRYNIITHRVLDTVLSCMWSCVEQCSVCRPAQHLVITQLW